MNLSFFGNSDLVSNETSQRRLFFQTQTLKSNKDKRSLTYSVTHPIARVLNEAQLIKSILGLQKIFFFVYQAFLQVHGEPVSPDLARLQFNIRGKRSMRAIIHQSVLFVDRAVEIGYVSV